MGPKRYDARITGITTKRKNWEIQDNKFPHLTSGSVGFYRKTDYVYSTLL